MNPATQSSTDSTQLSFEQSCGFPVWFGPTHTPLFGWLHRPTKDQRATTVVICPPFGHEYMVTHRAVRKLASRLAMDGYPTIRFDYYGCGDSSGRADDPGRLGAWLQSIKEAVNLAKSATPCAQIVLIGIRLGATLAALKASTEDIDGLVLVAPIVSGRKYVRELVAFGGLKQAPQDSTGHSAVDEVVGYPLSAETKHELSQIDLTKSYPRKTTCALILARDDLPGDEAKLAKSFSNYQIEVDALNTTGYKEMMTDDAYESLVPEALWSETRRWLGVHFPNQTQIVAPPIQATSETQLIDAQTSLTERVLNFQSTTAIITTRSDFVDEKLPTIIISNTGANHRVGNHRLCVSMARSWAARGFRVIRYDRPGTGDSLPSPGSLENDIYAPSGVTCVRQLMDLVSDEHHNTGFILAGLCSGAYFSYQTAMADPRVSGLLMINPLTYHWRDGDSVARPSPRTIFKSTDFYLKSAMRPETWKRLLRGEINIAGIASTLTDRAKSKTVSQWRTSLAWALRHEASVSDVGQSFIDLEARGVDILMVFDAAEGGIDLMEEHLRKGAALMRRRQHFRLEIISNADHTFTPLWSQSYLIKLVGDHWALKFNKATA